MYEKAVSRRTPACIIILIDRSDSMSADWRGTGMTLAEGAARAVNKILLELCVKSIKEPDAPMRDYFYVGCYGYGLCPSTGGEGVESALPASLASRGIVLLSEVAQQPVRMWEEPTVDAMTTTSKVPMWIEPICGHRTPMCEAIALTGSHVYQWSASYRGSFPAIVLNITDGMVTDSPHQGADLAEWASRMKSIRTEDGNTLLLNIFLSPSKASIVTFPTRADSLPAPGPDLFAISSELPPPMLQNARSAGINVADGARGFVFNADLSTLVSFLEIGTRVDVRDM